MRLKDLLVKLKFYTPDKTLATNIYNMYMPELELNNFNPIKFNNLSRFGYITTSSIINYLNDNSSLKFSEVCINGVYYLKSMNDYIRISNNLEVRYDYIWYNASSLFTKDQIKDIYKVIKLGNMI